MTGIAYRVRARVLCTALGCASAVLASCSLGLAPTSAHVRESAVARKTTIALATAKPTWTPTPLARLPRPVGDSPRVRAFQVEPADRLGFGEMLTVTWSV